MPIAPVHGTLNGTLAGVSTVSGSLASTQEVNGALSNAGNREGVGGGIPRGGLAGDLLAKNSAEDYDVAWVTPASSAEQDNTRPITAAAVYTEIGNINALLATI